MDAMAIAQMKRQVAWHEEELHHVDRDLQSAELAVVGNKKKVEELRRKKMELKRKLDLYKQDIVKAEESSRRTAMEERRRG